MPVANRVGAALLGLIFLALGLLAAAEGALIAVGARPWLVPLDNWHRTLSSYTLASNRVLAASIVVAVIGLVILAMQVRRWRPRRLATGEFGAAWRLARRSVEQRTAAAAAEVVGVHNARAKVRGNESRWRLKLRAEARPEQRDEITVAVRRELDRLAVPPDLPLDLSLAKPRRVA